MPRRFAFTNAVSNVDVYIPWTAARCPNLFPWIRLKPGVDLPSANAEFQSLLNQFKRETPAHFPDVFQVAVEPIVEPYIHKAGHTLALLFASVALLLVIGCANCSISLTGSGGITPARARDSQCHWSESVPHRTAAACGVTCDVQRRCGAGRGHFLLACQGLLATHARRIPCESHYHHQSADLGVLHQPCAYHGCAVGFVPRNASLATQSLARHPKHITHCWREHESACTQCSDQLANRPYVRTAWGSWSSHRWLPQDYIHSAGLRPPQCHGRRHPPLTRYEQKSRGSCRPHQSSPERGGQRSRCSRGGSIEPWHTTFTAFRWNRHPGPLRDPRITRTARTTCRCFACQP